VTAPTGSTRLVRGAEINHGKDADMEPLAAIEECVAALFRSRWTTLDEARIDQGNRHAGCFVIAYSRRNLAGQQVEARDVFYVGMSTSAGGVRARLRQFRMGIEGLRGHRGARRFFEDHAKSTPFSRLKTGHKFYAAAGVFPCDQRESAAGWRAAGHAACLEGYMVAAVIEQTGEVPRLNLPKGAARPVGAPAAA
jgi:hypothetical protein